MNGLGLHGGIHSVWRDVLGFLGLRAQRTAHGGAYEERRRFSCLRTILSGSARTVRRISRSSTLASLLRLMPNMRVWRPCDTVETAVAWRAAIERRDGPTSLILTRQNLPHQPRDADQIDAICARWLCALWMPTATRAHTDRDRLGGWSGRRCGASNCRRTASRARRVDAVHRGFRRARMPTIAATFYPPAERRAGRSRRA